MVDGPVAEHLEVLGVVPAGRRCVVEGVREADAVQRRLRDTADRRRRLGAEQVQDSRHHVDDVGVLVRTSPLACTPAGQETMNGSQEPPR